MAGAGGSGKPATRIHLPGGGSLLGAVLGLEMVTSELWVRAMTE